MIKWGTISMVLVVVLVSSCSSTKNGENSDREVGVTRVYVDKVKFKHLGVGGMASFVYDPVSGRYLPCEESHDPSLSADQRVRNTMFDNSCWLPEKELF